MTHRPNTETVHDITTAAQSSGSRLVRNPIRPAGSTLFGGWGPRLRP